MFESVLAEPPTPPVEDDANWFDPSWLDQPPEPAETGQIPAADTAASGWPALELDQVSADPSRLSDADLIDTITGFERVNAWSAARQADDHLLKTHAPGWTTGYVQRDSGWQTLVAG